MDTGWITTNDLITAFYRGLSHRDAGRRLWPYVDPAARHTIYSYDPNAPMGGSYEGRSQVIAQIESVNLKFVYERFEPKTIVTDLNYAAVELVVVARDDSTGQRLFASATHFLRSDRGKVTDFDVFINEVRTLEKAEPTSGGAVVT